MFNCCKGHTTFVSVVVFDEDDNLIGKMLADDVYIEDLVDVLISGACPVCDGWPLQKPKIEPAGLAELKTEPKAGFKTELKVGTQYA